MTSRITGTFNALVRVADFSATSSPAASDSEELESEDSGAVQRDGSTGKPSRSLRPEFHYNIQIHLPSNATEEVYLNIFNALRKTFQ